MKEFDKLLRDTINSIEKTPGYHLDKEAAWQKLQFRMQNRPAGRKRNYYYGLAAAIVLVCISVPFIFREENAIDLPKQPQIIILKQDSARTPVAKTETRPTGRKQEYRKEKVHAAEVPVLRKNIDTIAASVNTGPSPFDTVQQVLIAAATRPVRKKIEVVHINDVAEIVNMQPPVQDNFLISVQHKYRNYNHPPENTTGFPSGGRFKIKL